MMSLLLPPTQQDQLFLTIYIPMTQTSITNTPSHAIFQW